MPVSRTAASLTFAGLTISAALASACQATGEERFESGQAATSYKVEALEIDNPHGKLRTYTDNEQVSLKPQKVATEAFFQALGINGRTCAHCHRPGEGWTITPAGVQHRFTHPLDLTNPDCLVDTALCATEADPADFGLDPIFRTVDGANSPVADVSTAEARLEAYSMLLAKAVLRIGIGVPEGAEFALVAVDDPYGYASADELSLFRRPLPSANLRLSPLENLPGVALLTAVMWDGRETKPGQDIIADLFDQANGATLGHAEAAAGLTDAQLQSIVEFETGLHVAQVRDANAGNLRAAQANGGPDWLAEKQTFYLGINDVLLGDYQTGEPFTPDAFTIFDAWKGANDEARARIARGQELFNRKEFAITGVGGLNDDLGIEAIPGTCTVCHDAPNYGHHSVPLAIDIGVSDAVHRTPDMPLYTLRNLTTLEEVQTTDPGRALITGKWKDIGKFKGPILRGLASRPPYFHNGMAATVEDVIDFYDERFDIAFTPEEKADLAAFLLAL